MTGAGRLVPLSIAVLLIAGCTASAGHPATQPAGGERGTSVRHSTLQPHPIADALVRRRVVVGYSVAHKPIVAVEIGDADSPRRALIVGCIHGDEPAGLAIARALAASLVPPEVDLWVVPDLNPDGVSAGTRGNSDGVDLNRNFPDKWHPLGPPGSADFAGPRPLSDP